MSFAGDLKKLPLGDVFQSIHQNGLTGALAIRDGRGERLVAFESGFVSGCVLPEGQARNLREELVRRGVVESDLVRPSRFFRTDLKKTLKKRNVLDTAEFDSLARQVVLERVYDCFLLEEGSFEFLEQYDKSRFDDEETKVGLKIGAPEILMEAMRRIDEWRRIRRSIPSFREVYVATREGTDEDDDIARDLLTHTAEGTHDLESVIDSLPYPRFKCTEAVMGLVAEGTLRVATAPEYMDLGKAAEAKNDLETAASHFSRGLVYERGNPELNRRLIAILEKQGKRQAAADEHKRFAGVLLEQGQREKATEHYLRASELSSQDPLPLERLLDLQVEGKASEDARKTAERLVGVYLQLGLGEKAKAVYPRLLMLEPRDRRLREQLAETHARLHEGVAAATIYKELAQEQLEVGDVPGATRSLRRAVELAPDDARAVALLRDLETGEHAQRRRRRQRYVILAVVVALGGLGLGWAGYEVLALIYLRDASRAAIQELDRGPEGVLSAMVTHQAHRGAFEHSWAARWSDEYLDGLARLYLREVERSGVSPPNIPPPPPNPANNQQIQQALEEALNPPGEPLLNDLVKSCQEESLRAAREMDPEKRKAAAEKAALIAREGLMRIRNGRLVLVQASTQSRRIHEVRVKDPQPTLHLGNALGVIHHAPALQLIDAEVKRRAGEDAQDPPQEPPPQPPGGNGG